MAWFRRYLSPDDLISVVGYIGLIVLTRITNPELELAAASLLASGMLALFWLASQSVRKRNIERNPNARVVLWALVAVVSAAILVAL
ncbi:MAG TPA: hypothetical protein VFG89_08430 [Coriobacteriia bacterium]|nr:hypothetical protein [Coriobacteriia bacterium]